MWQRCLNLSITLSFYLINRRELCTPYSSSVPRHWSQSFRLILARATQLTNVRGLFSSSDTLAVLSCDPLLTSQHPKHINALDVSPNDKLLVSASQDKTAKVSEELNRPLTLVSCVALASIRRKLVGINVWAQKRSMECKVLACWSSKMREWWRDWGIFVTSISVCSY